MTELSAGKTCNRTYCVMADKYTLPIFCFLFHYPVEGRESVAENLQICHGDVGKKNIISKNY
jgi:hypothetical protein